MAYRLSIHPHSLSDYKALPKQVRRISETDQHILDEIGAILIEHGMQERFTISLLHQHFEYYDDELCFVMFDADKQSFTISPAKRCDLSRQSVTAISCCFAENSEDGSLKLVGLEYAPLSDLKEIAPISEQDFICLNAIYQLLVRNNAVSRFGVCLQYTDLQRSDEFYLMENSFPECRISVRRLINRQSLPSESAGPSAWGWSFRGRSQSDTHYTRIEMTNDTDSEESDPDNSRMTPKVYCDRGRFHDPEPGDENNDLEDQER